MTKKEWVVGILEGVILGLILFFGAVFSLMLNRDIVHMELFAEKLFLIMGGYILVVLAIKGILSISFIKKAAVIFQGAGIIWWGWLFGLGITTAGGFIPAYIRYIILLDAIVLICYWIGRFLYMKQIAEELNGGKWKKGFVFLEDIEKKPKNEDEFMTWIGRYCQKNGLDYEVLHYGIPAQIKMDGIQYAVRITERSSLASGIVPAIEFKRL